MPTANGGATPEAEAAAQRVPPDGLNPDVQEDTIHQTICVPGYTAAARPSTNYSNSVKARLMREQGLPADTAARMALEHRIPLALGGHPRNLKNLMLQPWEGEDGAKKKDRLERALQRLVCACKVLLEDARRAIYFDWQAAHRTYVMVSPPIERPPSAFAPWVPEPRPVTRLPRL